MANNSSSVSITSTNVSDGVVLLEHSQQMESDDISSWELVDPSDVDDSDDQCSLSDEQNAFVSWYSFGEISSPRSHFGNTHIGFEEKGCNFDTDCDEMGVNSSGFDSNCGNILNLESFDVHSFGDDVMGVNPIMFESDCGERLGMDMDFGSFGDQDCYDDEFDLSSIIFKSNFLDQGYYDDELDVSSIRFKSNFGKTRGVNVPFGDQGCYDDELVVNSIGVESNYGSSHGMDVKMESFDEEDHDDNEGDDQDNGDDGYGLDDDHDNGDDGYGLDDELVPWNVGRMFERQRMRKLGKRVFAKMNHSKRNPYMFVKPGCVLGKHGLGFKAD